MPTFQSTDGASLYFADDGAGLPVLALAGLTRNGGDFDHVAPHLPDVRLLRLDARGRGRSDFTGPETYNVWQEAKDAVALLDHLDLSKAAILGTSRGGLVGMVLAAKAKDRLLGVALNDVGPVIEAKGLGVIAGYLGRRPAQKTYVEAATARAAQWTGFRDVPQDRWLHEVRNHYEETPDGLQLRYDPRLREAFLPPDGAEFPALWPFFDALDGLPVAVFRGETSDILSRATLVELQHRRSDLIVAEVPGRGHVPFLDEPEAVLALQAWLAFCRTQAAG